MRLIFCLLTSLIISQSFALSATAQESTQGNNKESRQENPWEHELNYKDSTETYSIDVYTRNEPDNNIKAFKANTTVNASLETVLSILINVNDYNRLLYNYKHASIIYGSDNKPYLYTQMSGRWPVAARDVVLKADITQDQEYTVTMTGTGVANIYPSQEDHVRMTDSEAKWIIKPLSAQQTQIEFYGHADPAGLVPSWIVNIVLSNIPKVALINLHKLSQEPRYKTAKLTNIKPPQLDLSHIKFPYQS